MIISPSIADLHEQLLRYYNDNTDSIQSAFLRFYISLKTNATVTFWWYIESGLDTREYLAFDVSANGGPWNERAKLRGNVDLENTWHNVSINVTAINNLRIRFRATMSRSREDAYVDVVEVIPW